MRCTSFSSPDGTAGFSRDSGMASSNRIAARTAGIVGATHGRRLASIS